MKRSYDTSPELTVVKDNIREKVKKHVFRAYTTIKSACRELPSELCIEIMKNFAFKCMSYDCEAYIPIQELNTMLICDKDFEDHSSFYKRTRLGWLFEDYCVCFECKDQLVKCKDCEYHIQDDDVFTRGSDHFICHECDSYICRQCALYNDTSNCDEPSSIDDEYETSYLSDKEECVYCKECFDLK